MLSCTGIPDTLQQLCFPFLVEEKMTKGECTIIIFCLDIVEASVVIKWNPLELKVAANYRIFQPSARAAGMHAVFNKLHTNTNVSKTHYKGIPIPRYSAIFKIYFHSDRIQVSTDFQPIKHTDSASSTKLLMSSCSAWCILW